VTSNENSNSLGGPEQLTTINGSQRAQIGSVSFQLDGGNNTAGLRGTGNPAPNPEAVQEFRVITNSYAAEYGRYPAGVVDVVTKSGTNRFNGRFSSSSGTRTSTRSAGRPLVLRPREILSIATSTARRLAAQSSRTGRSSLPAIPACGRKRPTTAIPRPCRPLASGPATSHSPSSSPEIPRRTRRSLATSFQRAAWIRRRWRSRNASCGRRTCRTTSSRCGDGIPSIPTKRLSKWIISSLRHTLSL
jgi:hypothetical protein